MNEPSRFSGGDSRTLLAMLVAFAAAVVLWVIWDAVATFVTGTNSVGSQLAVAAIAPARLRFGEVNGVESPPFVSRAM
jgi:hypothetical protein